MTQLSRDVSITKLGELGEKLVANWIRSVGYLVEESLDSFDHEKDMIVKSTGNVDGDKFKWKVEVKTQVPFYSLNAFTVKENQLKKIAGCDIVYWVSVPMSGKDDPYAGAIFEMLPERLKEWKTRETKDGRKMYYVERTDPCMRVTHMIEDKDILNQLMELSVSEYNR